MFRLVLAAAATVVLAACSNQAPDNGDESRASPPPDLATVEDRLVGLAFWDELFYARSSEPPADLPPIIEALGASQDERYRAFLVDLAFYPNPFTERALEILLQRDGPYYPDDILTMVEDRGFKTPADDLPAYLEFKRRLLLTIDEDVAAFLDPAQPRTISAQEIHWGGVRVDGIPPLNDPDYVSPSEAQKWLEPEDFVIGVELNGDARAYPRRIIDWHEMVNDTIGGVPVSLAYCTLCGSAILYDGRSGDDLYRFGTSGLLYRSNKLMYDKTTRSLWEQYTGEPVWGPLVGQGIRLEVLPVVHTTWETWLDAHPNTRVLSIRTGFSRNYGPGEDGFGMAYSDYWISRDLIFPAPDRSGPLERKDYVYAVRLGQELTAYPLELLAKRELIADTIADQAVVVIATEDRSGGRAYARGNVSFESVDLAQGVLQSSDGRQWSITEAALTSADGERLERLPGHNSFWFSIANHTSLWRLYEE